VRTTIVRPEGRPAACRAPLRRVAFRRAVADKLAARMPVRLAAVVSHPIQYQAPLFRALARRRDVDLEVLFLSDHGVALTADPGFGREVRFDVPLVEGFTHRFVPNLSPRPSVAHPLGLVNPGLVRLLSRRRCDVAWIHGYAHASDWIAFAAAATAGVPFLVRGESTLAAASSSPLRRAVKRALLAPLARSAAGMLCVGAENRRFWQAYGVGPERLFDAPYGVENDWFASRAAEARVSGFSAGHRRLVGAGPDDVVLLFVGKLVDRKAPLDLVRAVAGLGAEGRRCVAVFVGDGERRPDVEAGLARAGVRGAVVGFANQSELPAWYAAADLLVLPSLRETWGLVVNEAMACGLPVVVSDAVGCGADLVEGQRTGGRFRAGDAGSLAAAIRPLVGDAAARREAAEHAIKRVAAYDVSVAAEGIASAAVEVAGCRGRR
jgi:glycosyltransferase involved in cell wall biosynthesis